MHAPSPLASPQVRTHVEQLHASTRASREALAQQRRDDAYNLRARLERERRKKANLEASRAEARQELHDEIRQWKISSVVE